MLYFHPSSVSCWSVTIQMRKLSLYSVVLITFARIVSVAICGMENPDPPSKDAAEVTKDGCAQCCVLPSLHKSWFPFVLHNKCKCLLAVTAIYYLWWDLLPSTTILETIRGTFLTFNPWLHCCVTHRNDPSLWAWWLRHQGMQGFCRECRAFVNSTEHFLGTWTRIKQNTKQIHLE